MVKNNTDEIIKEIEKFFNGNGTVDHIVNLETYYHRAEADCLTFGIQCC